MSFVSSQVPLVLNPSIKKRKSVEEEYKEMEPIEHVLRRPDLYIGSIVSEAETMWIWDEAKKKIVNRSVTYVPGLFKIFDEILVNACDNRQRCIDMSYIKVNIDVEKGSISVMNNGRGIPVVMHRVSKLWVPEFIFGKLRVGSNYDDEEKDTKAGRNGIGAKGTNIFSTEFTVETVDAAAGLTYKQTWSDNMSTKGPAEIKPTKVKKDWTRVTFKPDLAKFGLKNFDADFIQLMVRRLYDVAGTCFLLDPTNNFSESDDVYATILQDVEPAAKKLKKEKKEPKKGKAVKKAPGKNDTAATSLSSQPVVAPAPVKSSAAAPPLIEAKESKDGKFVDASGPAVGPKMKKLKLYLNDTLLEIKSFKNYCELYIPDDTPHVFYSCPHWEICVSSAPQGSFQQVSFVNGINTSDGGTHVSYILEQVCRVLVDHIAKKNKSSSVALRPATVKNHIWLFVNCLIVKPAFSSQSKTKLTTKKSLFGSDCELDEKFNRRLLKSGIADNIISWMTMKDNKELKKTDGKKSKGRITKIKSYEEANLAGTSKSKDCTLILTEGESAKRLAISGLSVVGRDYWGVFPLRGKMLNVRDAKQAQIIANAEINNLKQILGLKSGQEYTDVKTLRYGHVMIMADQDHDGSHIKGLFINLFEKYWPSLLKIPGFMREFVTPIVRVTPTVKRKKEEKPILFYTMAEYQLWFDSLSLQEKKRYAMKYFKGLGTSEPRLAKEYFADMKNHMKFFGYDAEKDSKLMEMVFGKKNADQRRDWIRAFDRSQYLAHAGIQTLQISDFINKELIHFSIACNIRAIPSLVDGLKPGQRKVAFGCFKRKLIKEIKVSQLSGYVSEHAAYHHGEAALNKTIIGLAQNYVGSGNNINLLYPSGQFGSRDEGTESSADARYIYTHLSAITRTIFNPLDDELLKYYSEDNRIIEPEWYVPIVPVVLINSNTGIGMGWRSSIPCYNPRDIVRNIKLMLTGESKLPPLHPWYFNFQGTITYREPKIEVKPKAESKVDEKVDGKSDSKSESKVDEKVDGKSDGKSESKEEAKPDGKSESKIDGKSELKEEKKVDGKSELKEEKKVDGKSESKEEKKTEGKKKGRKKKEAKPKAKKEPRKKKAPKKEPAKPVGKYIHEGKYRILPTGDIEITELPLMFWISSEKKGYKCKVLEKLIDAGFVKSFDEHHTDNTVHFKVILTESGKAKLATMTDEEIKTKFQLARSLNTTNMVLFDATGALKKYDTPNDILTDFFPIRVRFYNLRKEWMLNQMRREMIKISNRARFVMAINNDTLQIRNVPKRDVIAKLVKDGYDPLPRDEKKKRKEEREDKEEKEEKEEKSADHKDYDYLLTMPMHNLTKEHVELLKKERAEKEREITKLEKTPVSELWNRDLDEFLIKLDEHEREVKDYWATNVAEGGARGKRKAPKKKAKASKK